MASPRDVSLLDRAQSPLRAPFLTRFRHFVFIYGVTPQKTTTLLIYGYALQQKSKLRNGKGQHLCSSAGSSGSSLPAYSHSIVPGGFDVMS
jgi:hypothetical protein